MGQNSLKVIDMSNSRSDKQWAYWFINKSQSLRPKGKVAYGFMLPNNQMD